MTYSIDIINLCITHFSDNISVTKISEIINVSVANIYIWISKYNYNFTNSIHFTDNTFKTIKNNVQHKLNKINKFEELVCNYVNMYNGVI